MKQSKVLVVVLLLVGVVLSACNMPTETVAPTNVLTTASCGSGEFEILAPNTADVLCTQDSQGELPEPLLNVHLKVGDRSLVLLLGYGLLADPFTGGYWIHYSVAGVWGDGTPAELQCRSITPFNEMENPVGEISLLDPAGVFHAVCEIEGVKIRMEASYGLPEG